MRIKIVSAFFILLFQIHCMALAPRSTAMESWKDYSFIQSLLKMDLSGSVDHFKALADRILSSNSRILSEEEILETARLLDLNENIVENSRRHTRDMAYFSLFFSKQRLNDDSRNLFLLRDSISLYAAAKMLGKKADTFYVSKSFLEKASKMTYAQIAFLVQSLKKEMGLSFEDLIPESGFQKFKNLLFSKIYESMEKEKKDSSTPYKFLAASEMILNYFAQIPENLSGEALRLIDTTMTGNILLLIEALLKMTPEQRKTLNLPDFSIKGEISSLMFCSTLSPALGFTQNRNTGRAVEFLSYPVEFDYFDKKTSLPVMKESSKKNKQTFILNFIMLRNELLKILESPEKPELPHKNSPSDTSS